ncbi:SDR family oxidoreductase [Modestobacter sp. KNN46-3]|jgi:NAD(P)-dependent dehydrogenase (short-subunit alcohol dehydrogenase family)|uniref:SDR family oxidoreductase n=1 Tax=Modestobacter sp. KNN46-3 TaxID=2711218 RepID=UPI0019D05AA4|nr:SDR family oxidoreductase [Modestobacter sp. KNN46-3]
MSSVLVVIGPGQTGQAIARRVGVGKHVVLADMRRENADAAAGVLSDAGYDVSVATVDASSREAVHALVETVTGLGEVTGLIHAAGVSPSQASPSTITRVDLYGTALVLEEFGTVIAPDGAGVVIASQSGHRLPPLTVQQNELLATTPVEELLGLPFLQPDQVTDSLHAYQLAKRGNSLRVMAEAVRWGERGAHQYDQPRHRHDPPRPGRAQRPARRGLPPHDRGLPRGPGGHPRRGEFCRRTADGPRRWVHHRQRLPHGRRGDRLLLVTARWRRPEGEQPRGRNVVPAPARGPLHQP